MKPENLNKENFWDALELKYPMAMKKFKEWIDAYKKEVYWNIMFGNMYKGDYPIKFHDIPIEMQLGILLRFVAESTNDKKSFDDLISIKNMTELTQSAFMQIERMQVE